MPRRCSPAGAKRGGAYTALDYATAAGGRGGNAHLGSRSRSKDWRTPMACSVDEARRSSRTSPDRRTESSASARRFRWHHLRQGRPVRLTHESPCSWRAVRSLAPHGADERNDLRIQWQDGGRYQRSLAWRQTTVPTGRTRCRRQAQRQRSYARSRQPALRADARWRLMKAGGLDCEVLRRWERFQHWSTPVARCSRDGVRTWMSIRRDCRRRRGPKELA